MNTTKSQADAKYTLNEIRKMYFPNQALESLKPNDIQLLSRETFLDTLRKMSHIEEETQDVEE